MQAARGAAPAPEVALALDDPDLQADERVGDLEGRLGREPQIGHRGIGGLHAAGGLENGVDKSRDFCYVM